ncbi:MAG: uroporphyrinogen-III C-methyltransferase [Terriglobales bacterium]|jgi:uroporphyrin-III C-methyltransferase
MPQLGKVYLVGAGPGHPELLTLKAAELIRGGDVIVYDRLIQEEVIALARPSAERIYMGKPVGKHDSRQDEVNELLMRKAREGKVVIRLKGGDPFLFGRGGEEAEYLADHGIPFEVIPGVCSALSAPLSAGIAVTHRDAASSVAIVTGHNADGTESRIDWNALAKLDTLVFLMGVHNLEKIAGHLIAAGRSPDTPAAMVQMAFWHDEFTVAATLATIAEECRRAAVKAPATLVVGKVVRLREKLKNSQRDLSRARASSTTLGPLPDEVFRLATAGFSAQVLGWALENKVFDFLEEPKPVCDLAHALQLDTEALSEILNTMVALRLLESRPDGYRNLELASQYLSTTSPQSLRAALLYQAAQFCNWDALSEFARLGKQTGFVARNSALRAEAAECLAAAVASRVVSAFTAPPLTPVLVVGFGYAAYGRAFAQRWPEIAVHGWNLLSADPVIAPRAEFGTVIISGVLEWCGAAEIHNLLSQVHVQPDGILLFQDALLPIDIQPTPQAALRALARQVADGNAHNWSLDRLAASLQRAGFECFESRPLFGEGALVRARRAQPASQNTAFAAAAAD